MPETAEWILITFTWQVQTGKDGKEVHSVNSPLKTATSLGDSILLIFALCFHSVFEGIAIGVAETKADAWRALWTVCLHKIFAAIAMGIALLRMIPDRPLLSCAAYAFAFAISSPIGVATGIVIDATTQGAVADWIFAISMGLACGIFIYVSINHLLSKGYTSQKTVPFDTPNYKFLAVLLGIGVIAVVMIWDTWAHLEVCSFNHRSCREDSQEYRGRSLEILLLDPTSFMIIKQTHFFLLNGISRRIYHK